MKYIKRVFGIFFVFALSHIWLIGAPFFNLPHVIIQPNGQEIACFVSGDEFFHRIHDKKGYTVVQNVSDGFYYYARLDGDELVPTPGRVGACIPDTLGILPGLVIPVKTYTQLKSAQFVRDTKKAFSGKSYSNIVLFVRFNNASEFPLNRSVYNDVLNTGSTSVKNYYHEASYGNLELNSYLFPKCDNNTNLSVVVPYEKGYLSPYNASTNPGGYENDGGSREQEVVAKAIELAKSQIPSTVNVDANNDGFVDNITVIFRGENDGWGKIFWAHQWWLSKEITINGKKVGGFTFLPENQCNAGTVCHELFHSLGAPDLYHYTDNGITPVGPWDIMQGGYCHMNAYMKWKYSGQEWINSIPEIKQPGAYKLLPLVSSQQSVYKIASPFTSGEYFILEFRKKTELFEGSIPGAGLVVYRINPAAAGNGNGPPDEVYTYRPGGSYWSNGNTWEAHFSADAGRSFFNAESNPRCVLSDGMDGGIKINEITVHQGDSLTFHVDFEPAPEKSGWEVIYFDSEEFDTKASFAIDGDPATIWHTGWRNAPPAYPHELQIDLGKAIFFRTIKYTPRQDMPNGRIGKFSIYATNDPDNWGEKLAEGEFKNSAEKQTIGFPMVKARYLRLIAQSEVNGNSWASVAELEVSDQLPLVPKIDWKLVDADSFQPDGYEAGLAFDGKGSTFWHTKYSPVADPFPHSITVDMGNPFSIEAFSYLPRQDNNPNGMIKSWSLETSIDNVNWEKVASGDFPEHSGEKKVNFPVHVARYFRFLAISEIGLKAVASAAEISIFGIPATDTERPSPPVNLIGATLSDTEYQLTWDQATDNSGNLFYEVYKNDSLLGITDSTTMRISSEIEPIEYPFEVKMKAFDGAGNSSGFVRFMATKQTVGVPTTILDDIRVYPSEGGLAVSIPGNKTCTLQLFDITGRVIWQGAVTGRRIIEIAPTGRIILARFICNGNIKTKKITGMR